MNIKPLFIILFILTFSNHAWAADCEVDGLSLPNMQWKQIALPCNPPGDKNTVASIVGDVIGSALGQDAVIGTDFAVYAYDGEKYQPLTMASELKQGVGYWLIQGTGKEVNFGMPAGSKSTRTTKALPFSIFDEIPLNRVSGGAAWSMVGNPFAVAPTAFFVDFEGFDEEETCLNPGPACPLRATDNLGIAHKTIYRYNAANENYDQLEEGKGIGPWDGFWVATLMNAHPKDYVDLIIGRSSGT